MSADHVQDRLLDAVEALAVSSRPIQQRLHAAGTKLLALLPEDFDDPSDGARLEQILRLLSAVADPGEHGDLALTMLAMSDDEAVGIAGLVVELHRSAYRRCGDAA